MTRIRPHDWLICPTYRQPTSAALLRRLERLLAERYFR